MAQPKTVLPPKFASLSRWAVERTSISTKNGTRFIANIEPYIMIKVDDSVTMYFDVEKSHIFEPGDTGRNITLSD